MDWTDGAERYLAEHYGETIYDPQPDREEDEPEDDEPEEGR
jgi:hypothetical protein